MGSKPGERAIAAAFALIVGACGPVAPSGVASAGPAGRQCFNATTVNSFHAIGNDTVIVTVGASRYFELGIIGTCPEIDWSSRVALRSTSGSSWICEGLDAEFLVPSPSGLQRCPVYSVQPIGSVAAKDLIEQRR